MASGHRPCWHCDAKCRGEEIGQAKEKSYIQNVQKLNDALKSAEDEKLALGKQIKEAEAKTEEQIALRVTMEEMGFEGKGDAEANKEILEANRDSIKAFTRAALLANNIKMAAITNVTIKTISTIKHRIHICCTSNIPIFKILIKDIIVHKHTSHRDYT